MAQGYPDFFGFSVFPQYGPYRFEDPLIVGLLAGNSGNLFEVSGKGVLVGGFIYVSGTADHGNLHIQLTADGEGSYDYVFTYFQVYGFNYPQVGNFYASWFSESDKDYLIHPSPGLTFGQSLVIGMSNASAANITIASNLWWQQVTK